MLLSHLRGDDTIQILMSWMSDPTLEIAADPEVYCILDSLCNDRSRIRRRDDIGCRLQDTDDISQLSHDLAGEHSDDSLWMRHKGILKGKTEMSACK